MKRRTKLTPFAKIVILAIVFLGARYAYLHKDEISEMDFLNPKDSTESVIDTNSVIIQVDTNILNNDTIDLYITKNDTSIRVQTSDTIVEINQKDTLIYSLSEKDNLIGRIIFN